VVVEDVVEDVGVTSTAVVVDAAAVVVVATTVAGGAATSVVGTTEVDAASVLTVGLPTVHADTARAPRTTDVTTRLIQ
jgi:hypothetical protein